MNEYNCTTPSLFPFPGSVRSTTSALSKHILQLYEFVMWTHNIRVKLHTFSVYSGELQSGNVLYVT